MSIEKGAESLLPCSPKMKNKPSFLHFFSVKILNKISFTQNFEQDFYPYSIGKSAL